MELQGSAASNLETLQSQTRQCAKNRLAFSRLGVVHGRLIRMATRKIGESAITGRYMPVKAAQSPANKKTAIVRTIKTPNKPKGK